MSRELDVLDEHQALVLSRRYRVIRMVIVDQILLVLGDDQTAATAESRWQRVTSPGVGTSSHAFAARADTLG